MNEQTVLAQMWERATADVQAQLRPDLPYEWRQVTGTRQFRPWCKAEGKFMGWSMKISKDYPRTPSKVMKPGNPHLVVFNGAPVQVWTCGCGHEVVK